MFTHTLRLFCFLILLMPISIYANGHAIKMMSTDGQQYTLNSFIGKGKWVILNVWATRCPYCRHELFDLGSFHEKHHLNKDAEKDAMVLGLTIQLPEFNMPDRNYVAQFKEDYLIDYPLLLADQTLAQAMIGKPIEMVPLTFFYNPAGKLVYQIKGMVTEAMLEEVIQRKSDDYQAVWAKEMPPEYRPNANKVK